jgi:hypothetical protein
MCYRATKNVSRDTKRSEAERFQLVALFGVANKLPMKPANAPAITTIVTTQKARPTGASG